MKKIYMILVCTLFFILLCGCFSQKAMMARAKEMNKEMMESGMADEMMDQAIEMNKEYKKKGIGEVRDEEMAMEIINDTTLRKVIEVHGSADYIFAQLKNWIDEQYTEESDKITSTDEKNLEIKGTGSMVLLIRMHAGDHTNRVYFNYIFEVKENKLRFTIANPYMYTIATDMDGSSGRPVKS